MWLRALAALVLISSVTAAGQAPRPFPPTRPGTPTTPSTPPAKPANPASNVPTEATLGVPIYPNSQFLASYDAGQRQRFYLFGSQASFTELVAYYRTVLKERGDLLFEQPPTHAFEIGRFREETMAFPPSVTIKDYKFGGSEGYLNPKPGGSPARFPTIIQFVPPPPGTTK